MRDLTVIFTLIGGLISLLIAIYVLFVIPIRTKKANESLEKVINNQIKIFNKLKLNEAISKSKPNMDKIKDVDSFVDSVK